jgi:hypothetical protein
MDGLPPHVSPEMAREWERHGIDWRQLMMRLRMTPDERLRHLEEFIDDMGALRRDVARSRRMS